MSQLIYFDNNVLKPLFKLSSNEFDIILGRVFRHESLAANTFSVLGSSFVVLEGIGIRPTFISTISTPPRFTEKILEYRKTGSFDAKFEVIEELLNYLFEEYRLKCDLHPKLTAEYLVFKIKEQERFTFKNNFLFKDIILRRTSNIKDFRNILIDNFVLEKVLSHNFPSSISFDVQAYLVNTGSLFFHDLRPNSFARIYYSIAKSMSDVVLRSLNENLKKRMQFHRSKIGESPHRRRKRFYSILREARILIRKRNLRDEVFHLSRYGSSRDNIDSEMIHLLVFGYAESTSKVANRVIAITSDRIEVIIARIALYKSIINASRKLRIKSNFPEQPGRIYFFETKTRKITHRFEVSKVPSYFDFFERDQTFKQIVSQCIQEYKEL